MRHIPPGQRVLTIIAITGALVTIVLCSILIIGLFVRAGQH